MAVVLSSEEVNFFSSRPLQRSHSQPQFPSHYARSPSRSKSSSDFNVLGSPDESTSSSAPSSPRTILADSPQHSYAYSSTAASSLSLDAGCEEDDQITFPTYEDYYAQPEDLEPPPSLKTGVSYAVSPIPNSTSINLSRSNSPEVVEKAEDDTAVRAPPSRHVDYLSHNWKEEDIWSSWKLIVSKRNAYNNSARLENASWRTWTKSKNKLKTISPETLNWLKDCDVTWLYGPLQTGSENTLVVSKDSPPDSTRLSKSNSFLTKKPILKKRSMSEIMLQRSISSSSLLKQAAASVQAQQLEKSHPTRPSLSRAQSEYTDFSFSTRRSSQENHASLASTVSSGLMSQSGERRHIHFNEQVEQCIALEIKGDDADDIYPIQDYDDSDSDDGGIMMKRSNSGRKLPPMRSALRSNLSAENRTIAMLPSTTLKYRGDTPEPGDTAMKHSTLGTKLSPSPSQETLRPSKPSSRMLLVDDDDDDPEMDWQPSGSFARRRDSLSGREGGLSGLQRSSSSSSLDTEPTGMRRTPSGMFMPYEEDEDDVVSEGLFGKVVDTVNTAKDIAHVIWNVGWRR